MEYYSAMKRNIFESVLMRCMNLEPIIQWGKSERERERLYTNTYIQNLERWYWRIYLQGSNGASLVAQRLKRLPAMQETWVWSLGWEDSPGEGNGTPLQYSCLENLMDRGAWWATVHGVTKGYHWTRTRTHTHTHTHTPDHLLPVECLHLEQQVIALAVP